MDTTFIFKSGRKITPANNIIGIDTNLQVYEGEDDELYPEPSSLRDRNLHFTKEEKEELANYMIELWTRFKNK